MKYYSLLPSFTVTFLSCWCSSISPLKCNWYRKNRMALMCTIWWLCVCAHLYMHTLMKPSPVTKALCSQGHYSVLWNVSPAHLNTNILEQEEFQKNLAISRLKSAVLALEDTRSRAPDIVTASFGLPKQDAQMNGRDHLSSTLESEDPKLSAVFRDSSIHSSELLKWLILTKGFSANPVFSWWLATHSIWGNAPPSLLAANLV